jgi:hypothetical protein
MTALAASDYPFLQILWTILVFMALVIWVWLVFVAMIDIFARHDMSGWGKAAWVVFVIVMPYIGVLAYMIGNHDGIADRNDKKAASSQARLEDYVSASAGTGSPAAEIKSAKSLLDSGTITQAEFDLIKENALGSATVA